MIPVQCIGLFCEDIREEKNGIFTLVGIMPDNVNVEKVPVGPDGHLLPGPDIVMLPKICIYLRMNFDPEYEPDEATIRILPSNGEPIELGKIDRSTINKARTEAKEKGNILSGIMTKGVLGNYPIPESGSLKLEVVFPKEVILAAVIHFQPKPSNDTTSST